MEASYSARRFTCPAGGTNKRSVYMKPSYSASTDSSSHDAEMAPKVTQKGFKSFETLKTLQNIVKVQE
jgi:hypothetical protein